MLAFLFNVALRRQFALLLVGIAASALWSVRVEQSQGRDPGDSAQRSVAKTFRLADGTELPLEEWPETYETVEWQPPIDPKKAKTIVEYDFLGLHIVSVAVDSQHKKVYWLAATGGGNGGQLFRANLDGSVRQLLFNELDTPDGKSAFSQPKGLCVAPSLGKLYWTCRSPYKNAPGYSVFQANLDGSGMKAIITGLNSCSCVIADSASKKLYFNDDRNIQLANLDGSELEDVGVRAGYGKPFAIDDQANFVYSRNEKGILRQIPGGDQSQFYERPGVPDSTHSNIFVDNSSKALYWETNNSIVRASLATPSQIETIVAPGAHHDIYFAVDTADNRLYWVADNSTKLLSASLPKKWPKIDRPAPPLITSISPSEVGVGDAITISGSGLQTCARVLWVGFPSGETQEGGFRTTPDGKVVAIVPKMTSHCARVAIAIVAQGGTTITLPRDLTRVSKVVQVKRSTSDNNFVYVVQNNGSLNNVEQSIVLIEPGGRANVGLRGGNVFFVRNGATCDLRKLSGLVFHEPHANLTFISELTRCVPVPVVRPSYTDKLLYLNPAQ